MAIKQKIIQKANASFVDNWREAYKWLSVQLALVFGIFVTYATTEPEQVAKIVEFFPQEFRIPVGFLLTTVLPIYLRIKSQK
jgi:hypothetical protein